MVVDGAPGLDWVRFPACRTAIGADVAPTFHHADERPANRVSLPAFRMARTTITNEQYAAFVAATGHAAPGHWLGPQPAVSIAQHPVTYVDWHDALAFCAWAGVRLPTEAEWEMAARGTDGRTYPWGEAAPTPRHVNALGWYGGTLPVGGFPDGAAPTGALEMSGGAWEWTSSRYRPYPWRSDDGREDPAAPGPRVLRGGSFNHPAADLRCASRGRLHPDARDEYIGFRVAMDAAGSEPRLAIDWVAVPAGELLMGSASPSHGHAPADPTATDGPPGIGSPRHPVALAAYQLTRTPVTNAQYAAFVRATGARPPGHWEGSEPAPDRLDHPVVHVDWHEARAFASWVGARLPTEAEWEHAAAGEAGRRWPWGDSPPDPTSAWFAHPDDPVGTRPVHAHPAGATPEGVLDLAGNAWEWTSSLHRPYPYDAHDGREDAAAPGQRVLRGGSFRSPGPGYLVTAFRSRSHPTRRRDHLGFRVARTLHPSEATS